MTSIVFPGSSCECDGCGSLIMPRLEIWRKPPSQPAFTLHAPSAFWMPRPTTSMSLCALPWSRGGELQALAGGRASLQ